MKKRLIAAIIDVSIAASIRVGRVGAADRSEMRCCKSYSSVLEEHFDWLKSRFDSYIDYLLEAIYGGKDHTPSPMSFGDQPILM